MKNVAYIIVMVNSQKKEINLDANKRRSNLLKIWNIILIVINIPYIFYSLYDFDGLGLMFSTTLLIPIIFSFVFLSIKKVKSAAYCLIVPYPILICGVAWHYGTASQILLVFIQLAMFVPFFFYKKKEVVFLTFYVLLFAIIAYFTEYSPILLDNNRNSLDDKIESLINIISTITSVVLFCYFLIKENKQFEDSIIAQNKEILKKSNIIEMKNDIITESINYGKRIQDAMMPPHQEITNKFPKHFLIYKPKDIVGGDFYWEEDTKEGGICVAVADCTGHGVPGALMTMLGINLLSEIITHSNIYRPDEVLNELDKRIRKQLRQNEKNTEIKDGMDIVFCHITPHKLLVSSAQRPILIHLANHEWHEIKGDKNPIGSGFYDSKKFTLYEFEKDLVRGIYLYTDGCTDIFDAEDKKKLGNKNWVTWIKETCHLDPPSQGKAIQEKLNLWAGNTPPIDDRLIWHIRLN